ncbi:MAG TPA: tRNA (5-methylaminomethyl-2-thiouridine)(34)-methyltransferase MnmD [Bacteroidales bacterium]|nr:tRNA (5-methylaminomethyl-2-thiouridine)(34)-methyltransferase MnmD [Bacteroidales bacterium]
MNQPTIILTADGSHTLLVPELNEHYHSTNGALAESMHVFINAGLEAALSCKSQLRILEVGFGTGLNALLTLLHATNIPIHYTAIEPFPPDPLLIEQLNYSQLLAKAETEDFYKLLMTAAEDNATKITEHFTLIKKREQVQQISLEAGTFDLVYFDAFAPNVQPELWEVIIFKKIYDALAPGGILVTYSSKGLVKRNLHEAGFAVERLPGPAGKRHITRAVKSNSKNQ